MILLQSFTKNKKTCIARKKFITNFTNRQDFAHYCNLKKMVQNTTKVELNATKIVQNKKKQ